MSMLLWAHNPGHRYTKDMLFDGTKEREFKPYPSAISTWGANEAETDVVSVAGTRYVVGAPAEYSPLTLRTIGRSRLDISDPMYRALARQSFTRLKLPRGEPPALAMGVVVPTAWIKSREEYETVSATLRIHYQEALAGCVRLARFDVLSEVKAAMAALGGIALPASKFVGMVDIGGGTVNFALLEDGRPLLGESDSIELGTDTAIERAARTAGDLYAVADAGLRDGNSAYNDLRREYAEAILSEVRRRWRRYKGLSLVVYGGGAALAGDTLRLYFPGSIVLPRPQLAVVIGLMAALRSKYGKLATAEPEPAAAR